MRCRAPGQRARDWGDWSDAAAAQHPRPCDLSCRVLTGPGCLDPLGAQTVQGWERSCLLPLLSTGQSADAEARRESCIVGFWPSVHILPPGRHVRAALLSRPCARERIMGLLFAVSSSAGLAFPLGFGKAGAVPPPWSDIAFPGVRATIPCGPPWPPSWLPESQCPGFCCIFPCLLP